MTREEKAQIKRPLKDATIRALKPEPCRYEVLDDDGLYIVVEPSGKKVFRFFWDHRRGQFTIGQYIPLQYGIAQARKRRDEVKALVQQGIDPRKHFEELRRKDAEPAGILFSEVVGQYLAAKNRKGYKSSTNEMRQRRIEKHILPELGNCVMQTMTRKKDVLPFIKKMNGKGIHSETRKVLRELEGIFKFALINDWTEERAVTYGADMLLDATPPTKHRAAVTAPAKFGEILRRIDTYQYRADLPSVALALRLLPLVFLREKSVTALEWEEVDFSAKLIRKKGENMKSGEAFEVPLSRQALAILEEAKERAKGSPYVFPSFKKHKPISPRAVLLALYSTGVPAEEQTIHGFRSSAVSMIADRFGNEFPADVREAALSHKPRVAMGDTYQRARFLEKRAAMMQAWADYCDDMKSGKYGMPSQDIWSIS